MGWTKDIWDSFKNNTDGLSGRKSSAFWSIVVAATGVTAGLTIAVITKGDNYIYLIYALIAWLIFGAVCLGLVTIPELIKFLAELKNGKKDGQ